MSDRTFRTTGSLDVPVDVDLESCHTDPIHRTASLQPHGSFLHVDPGDHRILSAAANVVEFVGRSAEEVIGERIGSVFGSRSMARIDRWPRGVGTGSERFVFDEASGRLSVTLFPVGEDSGLELERAPDEGDVPEELMINARPILDRLRQPASLDPLFEATVRAVREVSGFDRVLLYRFDEEGHGSVVAEDRRDDVGSYLGQHFPASDIPEPARRLYRKNGIRHIPDVDYRAVPILGPDGERSREELDLTYSSLRGVPEVHRQYMRNMGVASSLSVPLMVKGELWGLIACHGMEPHRLGWARRSICELIGHTASQQIERIRAEEQDARHRVLLAFEREFEPPGRTEELFARLRDARQELLSLLDARAFCLRVGGDTLWLVEDAADEEPLAELLEEVGSRLEDAKLAEVRSIRDEVDESWEESGRVSGFLAVRLGTSRRQFCAWFRPEHRETVEWGGDPRRPVRRDPDAGLSPRESFEAWTQIVAGRCRRWTGLDRFTARELAKFFDEMLVEVQARRLQAANRELKARNEALEEARSELERANERREELLEEVKELARTDELTGLANRRELISRLEEEVARAHRYGGRLSLAIFDLDRFKAVNDRYGHQAGDLVLERVGELLRDATRESDLAGRYGGEEFALLLPETGADEATELAGRVLDRVRGRTFEVDGGTFGVTISAGISELETEEDADGLVRRADAALYRAKEEGRDRAVTA